MLPDIAGVKNPDLADYLELYLNRVSDDKDVQLLVFLGVIIPPFGLMLFAYYFLPWGTIGYVFGEIIPWIISLIVVLAAFFVGLLGLIMLLPVLFLPIGL